MNESKKISILKDTGGYVFANYLVQAIGVANSIFLRRFMGPLNMGVWSILQVILGYCGYASFGTTKAMARDYPYLRGRGESEKAERLKDLTLTFSMLMSLIPALLVGGYLWLRAGQLESSMRVGLIFILFFLFIQRFYDLLITLLRSDKKFGILGRLMVLNALGGLAVSVVFVKVWNLYGLFFGTAVVTGSCLFYILVRGKYRFRYYWNGGELRRELTLGIPLVVAGFLSEFLRGMDKLIIARQLGFYEVGLYSVAMMIHSYVFSLPMMFSHVWFPHLQEEYGRTGDNAHAVKHYLLTPLYALAVVIPFLSGCAIFLTPVLAHLFLPKFLGGLPAMKIYLLGTYFLVMAQFSSNFLLTVNKFTINVAILIVAVAVNFLLNRFALSLGWGLTGVAGGTAISFICLGLLTYAAALKTVAGLQEIFGHLFRSTAILISFFSLIFSVDYFLSGPDFYRGFFFKMILFLFGSILFFRALEPRTKLLKTLLALVLNQFKSPAIIPAAYPAGEE